ncbi:MAG: Fic family protein [Flavobacteriaceae bacterium]|nr:Fic family protein [Flavobacteriaceae bacterium]
MVVDHYNALVYTLEQAKMKLPISISLFEKINSFVKKRTGEKGICNITGEYYDTSSGKFRTYFVGIGLPDGGQRIFMDPKAVPQQVKLLLDDLNGRIEDSKDIKSTNLLAFEAHHQLASIHPFGDGNGRTSRLLMNYIQAYHNQPMTFILEKERDAYFKAIEQAYKTKDLNYFYEFMIDTSVKSMSLMNLKPTE